MKSRRRHSSSSEESGESADTADSDSSGSEASESDSEPVRRHKKHKRRAQSSGSDSNEEVRRRAKKRKHKKKKKKHGKKRRHDDSDEESSQSSEEEPTHKKHKHKHDKSKRRQDSRSPSVQEIPAEYPESRESRSGRVRSVVRDPQRSVSRDSASPAPAARYYDYSHESTRKRSRSTSVPSRKRDEGERFYRGASKDVAHHYKNTHDRFSVERLDRHVDREQERPRRDQYPPSHPYAHRSVKYEHPDDYRERQHKERDYPRESYVRRDTRAPPCLVCGESHVGRPCREGPPRRFHPPDFEERRPPRGRGERERDDRPRERDERYRAGGERYERDRSREYGGRNGGGERYPPRAGVGSGGGADRGERSTVSAGPPPRQRKSRFEEQDPNEYSWGKQEAKTEPSAPADKAKPDFGLSGKLAADTNTVNGIVLKYSEPPDAKQPKRRWRFYPFKGDKSLPILYIHRQSCFILGREHRAVDIPLEHPSISKQHAALQYRATPFTRPDGTQARRVRPYIIDLDSANGTFVNNKKIEPRRFVELLERDVVKFGFSQREYVLLHENSKDDAADDDQEMGGAEGGAVTSIATVKREKQVKAETEHDG